MSDYSDLDDEIRPHLVRYFRDVIVKSVSYYPELDVDFWPRTLEYFRHREAFYVHMLHLYTRPETAAKWGLSAAEVAEYKRIRNRADFTNFTGVLEDVEIRCGGGWTGILRRMMEEIIAADVKVVGLVADEDQGRLRLDYASAEPWLPANKIFVLAQFRSLYTCEICGRPGNHRRTDVGYRHTRCAAHVPPPLNGGRVAYDLTKTPWRQMSDGKWRYDPITDALVRKR